MIINDKTIFVYDIEVFPNLFTCSLINSENKNKRAFEISERKNDLPLILKIFCNKNIIFCGYNNLHYDDPIINFLLMNFKELLTLPVWEICKKIKNLSDLIITSKNSKPWSKYKYANLFKSIDLLAMLYSSKLRIGLKELQVTMNFKNVQEYDGDFNSFVREEDIDDVIKYNFNDIESTDELLTRCEKDIKFRIEIEKTFNVDVINKDSVNLGMEILKKRYLEKTGLSWDSIKDLRDPCDEIVFKDIIFDFIKFKTPALQNLLNTLLNVKKKINLNDKEDRKYKIQFYVGDLKHTFSLGGMHSVSLPEKFELKPGQSLIDSDVESMYPSIIINHKVFPPQLGEQFLEVYSDIKKERLEAKHNGDELKNKTYKFSLNGLSGNLQSPYSWCYSPKTAFKIRINGQLMLLMLAEAVIEQGAKLIQSNTDGIFYLIENKDEKNIMKVCEEWEKLTKFKLEHDYFERFYQYAINDYIGIKKGFNETKDPKFIKVKGAFLDKITLGKGMAPLIVAKACINYFVYGIPVNKTLKDCKDIKMFLTYQKVDKKFKVEYAGKYITRINRYYMSTNGYYMYKNELDEKGNILKQTSICADSGVTILNVLDDTKPIESYHINYHYYRNEIYKLILPIEQEQLSLF